MATQGPNGDFPYLPSGAAEVNRLIQENGDLFSESQCRVCNAVLISESQKLAHYQSKKHASKVRRYMATHTDEPLAKRFKPSSEDAESGETLEAEGDKYKACQVCNMSFSSAVVAQSHYQGKVHAKNLRLKSFGVQAPAVSQPVQGKKSDGQTGVGQGSALNDPNRFCTICQASFNNPVMAQQHYSGKKHKKHLTKQKLMETFGPSATPASTVKGYPCTMCNIELNSVEQYQAHISGAKHKNHVRLKEGGNSTMNPLGKKQPDYLYGYNQEQEAQEDWGSLKQDYESGGL
ncbi:zinc finger protein 346 isoform X2 [Neoarius graeffei]|uniref:zinc finger protein 346 isoform X2 n=1 Tax=Neoarius graeffei TaxID=443677 RepID=UPI00298D0D4A|nr:zinc finger protein 346 isoform X2 [Neoarius graeffei]